MTIAQQMELKEILDYDPESGIFTNKFTRGPARIGARAGANTGHGYRRIIIDQVKHYEHHLAWLFVYGEYPDELDHINGDRSDNRIANLRVCSRTENNFNREDGTGISGLKGAYLDHRNSQWFSKIQVGGQQIFLGNCDSPEEAHELYLLAAEKYAGEFAYHKRLEERA